MIVEIIVKAVVLGMLIYAWRSMVRRAHVESQPDHREGIQ